MNNKTRIDYSRQLSSCWEERSEPIVRIWVGDQWLLFPAFSFLGGSHNPAEESATLVFHGGAIKITGPRVPEFLDAFCQAKATLLKADGTDIVSVELLRNQEVKEEASDNGDS